MKTLEVMDRYFRGRKLSADTTVHYGQALRSLAEYSDDWPELGVVVNEWLTGLRLADTSVKGYYLVVKAVARYMSKHYKLPEIAGDIEKPHVAHRKRRYFTPLELRGVVDASRPGRERVVVLALMDSLMRIGELASLSVENIGDGFVKVKGKTGERVYRMNIGLCEDLRRMGGEGWVFKDEAGERLSTPVLKEMVRAVIKRSGLSGKKLGPHTIRHSGASLVALKTGSVLMVQSLLQHDDPRTSEIYMHDVEEKLQQEISPLALVMGESGAGGQLALPAPGETVKDGEVVEGELVDGSFVVDVPDCAEVRPLLRTEDLRLIREAFAERINSGRASGDEAMAYRALVRRMLRKVGNKQGLKEGSLQGTIESGNSERK